MSGTPLMQLYDHRGRRKYLTPTERSCFATAAARRCKRDAALCLLIHFTGCRLSEALHLTDDQIQREDRMIVLRSLKKRGKTHFRAIPVPQSLITLLDTLPRVPGEACVFTMHRATAWRVIKSVLAECRIEGAQAGPRGLRHGYGVGKSLPPTFLNGHPCCTNNMTSLEGRIFINRPTLFRKHLGTCFASARNKTCPQKIDVYNF